MSIAENMMPMAPTSRSAAGSQDHHWQPQSGVSCNPSESALDRLLASILLVPAPLIGLLMLLVRATSPGPGLIRQKRIGQGARSSHSKIRTMFADAECTGAVWSRPGDRGHGRILRRLHPDELPQPVNVLKGEMSLVGPRPSGLSLCHL